MRILMFNLVTDINDPVLGFTTNWIRALAKKVAFIHVITMRSGQIDVPKNVQVYSVGHEKNYSEPRRAVEFYRHLFHILREDHIDACFSHMIPIFSILAAPVLRPKGIPITTWFAHPSLKPTLKLAHYASNRMVTSLPSSYPYKKDKVTVVGQGIDTDLFEPNGTQVTPPMILCAGRLSPVKDHPTLLRAVARLRQQWGKPFQVTILGKSVGSEAKAYLNSLHNLVRELDIQDIVNFEPAVSATELTKWYQRCTLHVNLTPAGFGDKVAWESMSCGRPCLVANKDFEETLGTYKDNLLFCHQDPENLTQQLLWGLMLNEQKNKEVGTYLREQVIKLHSLDRLAEKLINIFKL